MKPALSPNRLLSQTPAPFSQPQAMASGGQEEPATPPGRPHPAVSRVGVARRPDGTFEIAIDHYRPFTLSPELAMLVVVLANNGGHLFSADDRCVGFKTTAVLVNSLGERLRRIVTRPLLARWCRQLRAELDRRVPNGGALVQARHGVGWRLARLRRADDSTPSCRRPASR